MSDIVKLPSFDIDPIIGAQALSEATDWTWDFYDIEALHKRGWYGQGEKVAIFDTGHNSTHPDLQKNVIHVEDFTGSGTEDKHYHSTWIHGRIGAEHNGRGVKGIAPEAKIGIFKVLGDNGSGSLSAVIKAIYRAVELGYTWGNMSLGLSTNVPTYKKAIDYAASKGMFIVAATGNDSQNNGIDYPGNYLATISCGSHDKNGKRSKFSDSGPNLDIYDAGEKVLSTTGPDGYGYYSGTSMATPTALAKLVCIKRPWEQKTGKKLTINNVKELTDYSRLR